VAELIGRSSLRVALIIGRFPQWRRPHLDAIRRRSAVAIRSSRHRSREAVGPMLRSFIANLAHLARFVIADLAVAAPSRRSSSRSASRSRTCRCRYHADGEEPPELRASGRSSLPLPGHGASVEIFDREILQRSSGSSRRCHEVPSFESPLGTVVVAGRSRGAPEAGFPSSAATERSRFRGNGRKTRLSLLRRAEEQITAYFEEAPSFSLLSPRWELRFSVGCVGAPADPLRRDLSYSALARRTGRRGPSGAGAANGKNPISIVIPCIGGGQGWVSHDYGGGSREGGPLELEGWLSPGTCGPAPPACILTASRPRPEDMRNGCSKTAPVAVAILLLLMTVPATR